METVSRKVNHSGEQRVYGVRERVIRVVSRRDQTSKYGEPIRTEILSEAVPYFTIDAATYTSFDRCERVLEEACSERGTSRQQMLSFYYIKRLLVVRVSTKVITPVNN
eukprot:scaffold4976_cov161-Amphora_coffeaeformis.AAC.12